MIAFIISREFLGTIPVVATGVFDTGNQTDSWIMFSAEVPERFRRDQNLNLQNLLQSPLFSLLLSAEKMNQVAA